ncbi:MAG: ATP-binding protein [Chitinispirillaceae bacterium]|nr:ATP-binding protein [Chitinispirillaceae bacterium]
MMEKLNFVLSNLNFDNEKAYIEKKRQYELSEMEQKKKRMKQLLSASGFDLSEVKQIKEFVFLEFLYQGKKGEVKNSKELIEKARQWWNGLKDEYPFLVLVGNKGTGKTALAKKIAYSYLMKGGNVFFIDKKMIDAKAYEFDNIATFIETLIDVNLLVIDDLLSGHQSDFKFAQVFTILDARYRMKKPTILTMNEDIRTYRDKNSYEDIVLLADRLVEVGLFIEFDYPSLRDPNMKEAAKNGDIRHLQVSWKKKEFSF